MEGKVLVKRLLMAVVAMVVFFGFKVLESPNRVAKVKSVVRSWCCSCENGDLD